MARIEKVESDLRYVRAVLDRADTACSPASIYFLWAVIGLAGFALIDLRPQLAGAYWSIAGPLGGLVSFLLGWRWSRAVGQGSMRIARYHALHWSGMLVAIFLLVPLHVAGMLSHDGLARAILVVLALGYFTAGIYLVRAFLWIGLVMTAGYALLFLLDAWAWTVVGALFAASLLAAGVREARREPSRG